MRVFKCEVLVLFLALLLVGTSFSAKAIDRNNESGESYDLIINGAGLNGYYTALEASKRGLKVLVLDKRTSPGYDVVAKRKLWIKEAGIERWDKSMLDLFFPVEEQKENWNEALQSPRRSKSGDELLVFAGSLKKEMLKTLLESDVDVLLMNDVWGIMTDHARKVTGVLVASKHGTFSIKGRNFIDATDNNFFTRNLFNQKYSIKEASFVLEFDRVEKNKALSISIPNIGIAADEISVHAGKKADDLYLLEYRFPVKTNDLSKIERQARFIAMEIGRQIHGVDTAFAKARLHYTALECAYLIAGKVSDRLPVSNYAFIENSTESYSCNTILQMKENARRVVDNIEPNSGTLAETSYVYYGGKSMAYKDDSECVYEKGFPTMLSVFPVELLNVKAEKASLLVAGAGTAGTMVALGAAEKKAPVTVVEYFYDLGGTKTMAGVNDFYFGFQGHKFIQKIEKERKDFGAKHGLSIGRSTIPRRFYYLNELSKENVNIINGAIICGVEMAGRRLSSVYICENGKIRKLSTQLTVDATGDADIAYFAGENYSIGDSRMGITQDYSHWDVAYRPKQKDYNRDYDIINSTEVLEYQRGLYLAHSEAHYYDFYPMQAIRESRRPDALYNLNMRDILRGVQHSDVISQTRSDYDPHYFSSSELSRCGLMLPHFDNKEMVNIPYRAIVPRNTDGLLYSGKGIGQTYKALQFTRMSADVTVLGYVTGLISAEILKKGVQARDFSVESIQKELVDKGYLPADLSANTPLTTAEIIAGLEKGDESCLLKACLEPKEDILPALMASFNRAPSLPVAKALAWFGQKAGTKLIINELEELYRQEQLEGHADTYFEKYNPEILYWKINQNIGFLAMSGDKDSNGVINKILSETRSGGPMVVSADAYTKGRIDLQLQPYYNRIVNLCFYIERNPAGTFIPEMEMLLADENIKNHKTGRYDKTRWRLYGANLELFVAAAAARCGSQKGLDVLAGYLNDIHSDFRNFSCSELKAITGEDFGYDADAWKGYLKKDEKHALVPLEKTFEI